MSGSVTNAYTHALPLLELYRQTDPEVETCRQPELNQDRWCKRHVVAGGEQPDISARRAAAYCSGQGY